jgi:hypothetical protein
LLLLWLVLFLIAGLLAAAALTCAAHIPTRGQMATGKRTGPSRVRPHDIGNLIDVGSVLTLLLTLTGVLILGLLIGLILITLTGLLPLLGLVALLGLLRRVLLGCLIIGVRAAGALGVRGGGLIVWGLGPVCGLLVLCGGLLPTLL